MENLNQVVEAKLAAKLRHGNESYQATITRLIEEGKIARDFIFEIGTSTKGTQAQMRFSQRFASKLSAVLNLPTGQEWFNFNKHATLQLADKLRIPATYLTTLLFGDEWQRSLAYEILNRHNEWYDRDKVLIRAVGDEVRGVLSDRFRRFDTKKIFATHVEEVYNNGGQVSDAHMDDTIVSVESMMPQPIEVHTENNGLLLLAFGTRLSTFDYGGRAQILTSFVLNGVCLNGLTRETELRNIHLGAKLPDNMAFSQRTYELDSETTASAVRDATRNLYGTEVIRTRLLEIKASTEQKIDPSRELRNLYIAAKMLKSETEEVGKILMQNNPEDGMSGEATLWKLTQGITRYANQESVGAKRRIELQAIAGDLFDRIKQ